eukprot:3878626-Amphidinium_carterae.2
MLQGEDFAKQSTLPHVLLVFAGARTSPSQERQIESSATAAWEFESSANAGAQAWRSWAGRVAEEVHVLHMPESTLATGGWGLYYLRF